MIFLLIFGLAALVSWLTLGALHLLTFGKLGILSGPNVFWLTLLLSAVTMLSGNGYGR